MTAQKKNAHLAGFIYLIVVVTGMFSLGYVPSKLIAMQDPVLTFQHLQQSSLLFRAGIASSMLCYIAFLFLPLALYRLLSAVNKTAALLMVILAVVSVPMSLIPLQHELAVLKLVEGTGSVNGLDPQQLPVQVIQLISHYHAGLQIAQLFWGLWLLPFGYLVFKSGFLPKLLGIFLAIGCFGYLITVFGKTLNPHFGQLAISDYITIPGSIGEFGICLWLLILGDRAGFKSRKPTN